MSWSDLVNHPYIAFGANPLQEKPLFLTYSENTGYYQRDDGKPQVDDSFMMQMDPHNYLNERNAIMLNCKDSAVFNNVYEHTIRKQLVDQMKESQMEQAIPQAAPEEEKHLFDDREALQSDHEEEEEESGEGIVLNANSDPLEVDIDELNRRAKEIELA